MIIASTLSDLMPTFVEGTQQMQQLMLTPAALICYAGLLLSYPAGAKSPEAIGWATFKLAAVAIIIGQIMNIGNALNNLATVLTESAGFNMNVNVLQDFQVALATKFNLQVQQGNPNPFQWLFNGLDAIGVTGLGLFVYFASMIAACMMFFVLTVQQILFYFEIALSPLFLACIMIPSLRPLAVKWATFFVSVCIMPIGFRIVDMAVKALLDIAVNTSSNPGLTVANLGAAPLLWLVVAFFIFFGYPLSALFVGAMVTTSGTHGMSNLLATIWGASMTASAITSRGAASAASTVASISSPAPVAGAFSGAVLRPGFSRP